MKDDWEQTTLGEVVSFKGGGTPSTEEPTYWNGDIPWVSPKDMKFQEVGNSIDKITREAIDNSAASLIPKDAILIVVRSGILARTIPVAITTRRLAVNQDIKALCPKKDIDPRYLHYFMQMSEPEILRLVTRGATVHRLSTESLKALKFTKPPRPEQQRIVAILDEAFAGLATATGNTERNLKSARELFDSYLNSTFNQSKTLNFSRDNSRHREMWARTKVGDLITIQNGFAFDSKKFSESNGMPLVRIRDLKNGRNTETRYFGPFDKRYEVKAGDYLIGMDGEFGCYEWKGDKALLNQRVCRLEEYSEKLEPRFLFYGINKHLKEIEDTTAYTTVKHLSSKQIANIEISLPPLSEQHSIVAILDALCDQAETLATLYRRKIGFLAETKQSILQVAFSGELTSRPSQAIKEAAE